jgi:hypothetical protein
MGGVIVVYKNYSETACMQRYPLAAPQIITRLLFVS